MTKLEALRIILRDYESERKRTKTSYHRCMRALRALGLTDGEVDSALQFMEYHSGPGTPYGWLQHALSRVP